MCATLSAADHLQAASASASAISWNIINVSAEGNQPIKRDHSLQTACQLCAIVDCLAMSATSLLQGCLHH